MQRSRANATVHLDNNDVELGSLHRSLTPSFHDDGVSNCSSLRSSLDNHCYLAQECEIHTYDDGGLSCGAPVSGEGLRTSSWRGESEDIGSFRQHLKARDPNRTRWINVIGWSNNYLQVGRKCFSRHTISWLIKSGVIQNVSWEPPMLSFGGGVQAVVRWTNGHRRRHEMQDLDVTVDIIMLILLIDAVIWLQTRIWFVGKRNPIWSSICQIRFRMVVCLPTANHAGTIITNFLGPYRLAQEVGSSYVERVLEAHSLGHQTLGCVWLLAFAILRVTAEQLNFAFDIFDPIESSSRNPNVPRLHELPYILEKSNRLARIDRYLSGLEEFLSFFISVRQHLSVQQMPVMDSDAPAFRSLEVTSSASFEAVRAREKIQQEQRLCRTYMRQYDTLVQLVISYSATQITERLDSGQRLGEQFAKIGMFLAALAGVVAPLSLLTGFYGMNVQELVPGTSGTLFGFWRIGISVLLLTTSCIASTAIWIANKSRLAPRTR